MAGEIQGIVMSALENFQTQLTDLITGVCGASGADAGTVDTDFGDADPSTPAGMYAIQEQTTKIKNGSTVVATLGGTASELATKQAARLERAS